ncbi:hypothetical protein [Bacillus sp. K2I17]|uniref:hypothetical protein n=1 Tax=Bacillus sp. K2I17 TaxID=2014743 RepID=UPI000B515776|nr:hypothetical protein [Bacillus sp. K2I17]OWT48944.1 hypothetical protein CER22_23285 [Bacillus sp. K2I17]
MQNREKERAIREARKLLRENGDTITTEGQKLAKKKIKRKADGKHEETWFSWQNYGRHLAIEETLNDVQKGALLLMSTFIKRNSDGILIDTRGGEFTVNQLAKLTGKSPRQAKRIVTECENIGALTTRKEGKETIITFTEMLYKCGSLEGDKMNHVKVFQQRVREVSQDLTLKELGLLADLLAHFHWKTHILCANPTEYDMGNVQPWRVQDIVSQLGYNHKFVTASIRKFKANRILIFVSAKVDFFVMNPYIASKQAEKVTLEEIEKVADSVANNPNVKYYENV